MSLELNSFKKAIDSFDLAIKEYEKDETNLFVRDSVIQRFEFVFEISFKYIKRFLEQTSENPNEIDMLSYKELICLAFEKGLLLNGYEKWLVFRQYRNESSHTYDEQKSIKVVAIRFEFFEEASYLLKKITERNHD